MPFKRRLLTDPMPNRTPDVDIILHGQIMLRSDGIRCDVALNPLATNHVLTIEARTKVQDQADVIRMRHVGPLQYRRPTGMTIDLNPRADTLAAWKCVGEGPIDYDDPPGGNPSDFRWILNLEGEHFHGRRLNPEIFNSEHVIRLQGGEYYFRTGVRSPAHLRIRRGEGGKGDREFKRIGAVARASLYLNPNQSVFLKWIHEGDVRTVTLTRQAGVRHEIYIENTPLYDYDNENLDRHDELRELYKVIPEIEEDDRFTLKPFRPEQDDAVNGDRGTPSIPCQVVRLDDPDGD
jgi:hypothetical protein